MEELAGGGCVDFVEVFVADQWAISLKSAVRLRADPVRLLLVTPNSGKKSNPVFAHYLADALHRPAFALEGGGQIGEVLQSTKIDRHGDLSEIHQFSAVTLVMADVSEEFIAVSLGEVSPYSDLILAYDLHHILDRFHDIVERSLRPSSQERGKHRNPDKTALVGDGPQLLIGFVARVCLERRWKAMRIGTGFFE